MTDPDNKSDVREAANTAATDVASATQAPPTKVPGVEAGGASSGEEAAKAAGEQAPGSEASKGQAAPAATADDAGGGKSTTAPATGTPKQGTEPIRAPATSLLDHVSDNFTDEQIASASELIKKRSPKELATMVETLHPEGRALVRLLVAERIENDRKLAEAGSSAKAEIEKGWQELRAAQAEHKRQTERLAELMNSPAMAKLKAAAGEEPDPTDPAAIARHTAAKAAHDVLGGLGEHARKLQVRSNYERMLSANPEMNEPDFRQDVINVRVNETAKMTGMPPEDVRAAMAAGKPLPAVLPIDTAIQMVRYKRQMAAQAEAIKQQQEARRVSARHSAPRSTPSAPGAVDFPAHLRRASERMEWLSRQPSEVRTRIKQRYAK